MNLSRISIVLSNEEEAETVYKLLDRMLFSNKSYNNFWVSHSNTKIIYVDMCKKYCGQLVIDILEIMNILKQDKAIETFEITIGTDEEDVYYTT